VKKVPPPPPPELDVAGRRLGGATCNRATCLDNPNYLRTNFKSLPFGRMEDSSQ
jgi:hypothetical protein